MCKVTPKLRLNFVLKQIVDNSSYLQKYVPDNDN